MINPPAFPRPLSVDDVDPDITYPAHVGMTLRDYFAAKAMQGLIASPRGTPDGSDATDEYYAKNAYIMADAMLKARQA
jgi:hypothetical protein